MEEKVQTFPTNCRRLPQRAKLVLAVGLGLLTVGCSSGKLPLASAGGKVTYQGKPLEFGTILFQPTGGGLTARGEIQPDGTFVLGTYSDGDGAVIGKHKISITCNDTQRPGYTLAPGAEATVGKSLIPEKYTEAETSGLQAEVTADGDNQFTFELMDE